MADNTTLDSGTGGDVIATDDILGVKYQRVKLIIGADGTNDGDVASGNPLPVSGTVTANLSATDNAVLDNIDADTSAIQTAVELIDNAISGAGFNITQFGGAAVPIGAGLEATAIRVTLPTNGTGVVTANAGTNLNTSALALETGGNLASAVTALQLI